MWKALGEVNKVFKEVDRDNNWVLGPEELRAFFKEQLGIQIDNLDQHTQDALENAFWFFNRGISIPGEQDDTI